MVALKRVNGAGSVGALVGSVGALVRVNGGIGQGQWGS